MLRKIIKIDEEKCNGCGICVTSCHEGAIDIVDGKAKLVREHFCDGLGDCLQPCPQNAISFEFREAPAYDEAAVMAAKTKQQGGCPSSQPCTMEHSCTCEEVHMESQLNQWPCQIKLVPVQAPFFNGADLLIAADCTAFAYASMHHEFMAGKITLNGCTKLDNYDYSEKFTEIFMMNDIKSIHVVKMEVPCCGGMEYAVKKALQQANKNIPLAVTTISIDGKVLG